MYSINFDSYISDDLIKIEIVNGTEVLYEELVNNVENMSYTSSHEMSEPGEYLVNLYINDYLSDSVKVDIFEPTTSITEIKLVNEDSTISYVISFEHFNSDDEVSLVISSDGEELLAQPIESVNELQYSGTYEATVSGTYTFLVYVNDDLADSNFVEVTVVP